MFKGSLYGTAMQSLTLVIWGACRTLDGPGFKPLISKASKLISFDGKESPRGIFRNGSSKQRGVAGCVHQSPTSLGLCGPVRVARCGAYLFMRLPRVGEEAWAAADGWNSATVGPHPSVTAP